LVGRQEVADIRNGGNKKAAKKWLAKLSKSKFNKDLKVEANLKEYMDLVYRDKAFYANDESDGEEDVFEEPKEKQEKKKKEKSVTPVPFAAD
jgi:hypothetical protein